jgi:protein TonB
MRKTNLTRLILFVLIAAVHLLLILFFAITVDTVIMTPEQPVTVMKLTDFEEEVPPPPPPPPPPEPSPTVPENAVESIAETMIETEEVPEDQIVVAPGTLSVSQAVVQSGESEEVYLPMHRISVPPVFSEKEILAALVYPPIALRSGVEGLVHLELFVDRKGVIQQISILRENPPQRGFGEAAVNAFKGIIGKPAEANGVPVAVRYRYPVRFNIKG